MCHAEKADRNLLKFTHNATFSLHRQFLWVTACCRDAKGTNAKPEGLLSSA
jgi:hypothetical protein